LNTFKNGAKNDVIKDDVKNDNKHDVKNDLFSPVSVLDTNQYRMDMFSNIVPLKDNGNIPQELQLSALLEGIRMGRVYLLNSFQAIAGLSVCCVGMGLWPLLSTAIPLNISPNLPPIIALLFTLFYIPMILLAMLNGESPDNVMKNTPRKNKYQQRRDEIRFLYYLMARGGYIGLSVFLIGWMMAANMYILIHDKDAT
jgi:hypothetical protein